MGAARSAGAVEVLLSRPNTKAYLCWLTAQSCVGFAAVSCTDCQLQWLYCSPQAKPSKCHGTSSSTSQALRPACMTHTHTHAMLPCMRHTKEMHGAALTCRSSCWGTCRTGDRPAKLSCSHACSSTLCSRALCWTDTHAPQHTDGQQHKGQVTHGRSGAPASRQLLLLGDGHRAQHKPAAGVGERFQSPCTEGAAAHRGTGLDRMMNSGNPSLTGPGVG